MKTYTCTVKPVHVVTSIERSPLSCPVRKFHLIWTSFKRSPVLNNHFVVVPKVTSLCRFDCIQYIWKYFIFLNRKHQRMPVNH